MSIRQIVFFGLMMFCIQANASNLNIQQWRTDNDLNVLFVETHELPMVDMRLSFRAASSRDADLPGIAKLVNGLLVEGSGDLSAQQIAFQFEQAGALFGFRSNRDMAWTSLRSLSNPQKLNPVIDLFARVTALPDFPQDALTRDRAAILASLAEQPNRISAVSSEHFYRALYPAHPYGHGVSGNINSIRAIKREDLLAFHHRYYVAANAALVIVGDLTTQTARAYAQQISAYLHKGEPAKPLPKPELPSGRNIRVDFDTEQTQVRFGMPMLDYYDPDYYELTLANHIIGGMGSQSRLMKTIREQRGLAYSAYSYMSALEAAGPFELGLQTRNHQVEEAVALLDDELQKFVDIGPSEAELVLAKKHIAGGFALQFDSNRNLLNQLSVVGFYRLPLDHLQHFMQRIQAVQLDDIRRVLKQRIKPEQMIRVIVGPIEKSSR